MVGSASSCKPGKRSETALDVVSRIDSPVKEADVLSVGAQMYFDMGDTERGLEFSRRGAERADSVNGYECAAYSVYITGMGYLQSGSWAEAEAVLDEAARTGRFEQDLQRVAQESHSRAGSP